MQLVWNSIRQTFWILSTRTIIRSKIHKCNICFLSKPFNQAPILSSLPITAVSLVRTFTNTPSDLAGPFQVKICNAKVIEAYICVFVCLAVHIEIVTHLSSESFIAALNGLLRAMKIVLIFYQMVGPTS